MNDFLDPIKRNHTQDRVAYTAPKALRCLADLAWLLQSTPLLSLVAQRFSAVVQAFNPQQTTAIAAWLTQVDADHLQAFVQAAMPAKAAMRLGRYAERLMEYYLRHGPCHHLIAANVPLRHPHTARTDHTTVGEFDYLLQTSQGDYWHWELAVKFYLCHPNGVTAQSHDFKGPAGVDTLGLKLNKIFDRQLQHLPPPPYDTVTWQPAAYARGYLFYPFGAASMTCDALNPNHATGWWMDIAPFTQTPPAHNFVHLPRLYWLAPFHTQHSQLPVLNHADMVTYLQAQWLETAQRQPERAGAGQLLACVEQQGTHWVEVSRGFVTART